ncbi:hypothetical protein HN51_071585, partial [Arachis hypogaea]
MECKGITAAAERTKTVGLSAEVDRTKRENLTDDDVRHGGEAVEEKRRWWPKEEEKRVGTRERLRERNWR